RLPFNSPPTGKGLMGQLWHHLQAYLQPNDALIDQCGPFPRQASVLMLFTDDPHNSEIVFTLRAKHLSKHPGEVAFPGGMWEPQDASLLATALRESNEEVGLDAKAVTLLGACSPRATRAGVR